jgi:L-alanine-DL-glutamate epimerase-like enolase superfamily enzyme
MKQENGTVSEEEIVTLQKLQVHAYSIPTDFPEGDGTFYWKSTTLVLVELWAAGKKGIGFTYANEAAATLIKNTLKEIVIGKNVMDIPSINRELMRHIRNDGTCGIAMMAISAVDTALWDLKAKILDLPLYKLLGKAKDRMLVYGSGGFTTYSKDQLHQEIGHWIDQGIHHIKIKVGSHPKDDLKRVKQAREIAGKDTGLFIDANGAYTAKQAIENARQFAEYDVVWLEEPLSSDNLEGLRFVKEHTTPNIAAGEYGYNLPYFKQMLSAGAVDILQADATRCGGISGFLKAGHLAEAYDIPFSSHCAPSLHLHAALALPSFYIAEYFHDHARIESMLFDGIVPIKEGYLQPATGCFGLGLEFKHRDAEKYKL